MRSFLPTLKSLTTLRWGVCRTHVRPMSRSLEAYMEAMNEESISINPPVQGPTAVRVEFEDLGLHSSVITALRSAFPNVRHPTDSQTKFIPAILAGKDVLLKDGTGSGKSFGLLISLLNHPLSTAKERSKDERVRSLILVPHRDLAYQIYHWIETIYAMSLPRPYPSILPLAQVLVRDDAAHLTDGLRNLRQSPPHILIGTPQAIMDVYNEDPHALQLLQLKSVVVDEVDYLIETVSKKDPKKSFYKSFIKANKKLLAHPGVTRQLLDIIFAKRKEVNARRHDEPGAMQHRRRAGIISDPTLGSPQLILSSATLRSHLNDYLFKDSGWLNNGNLLKVKGTGQLLNIEAKETIQPHQQRSGISHSVLLVSDDGIRNVAGAVSSFGTSESKNLHPIDAGTLFAPSAVSEPAENDSHLAEKYVGKPSPFNPNALEAIATAFALDVPSVALLVLPSSSSVTRAVYELREMGVNAYGLDLLTEEKGKSHLLRGGGTGENNPTLLVSTVSTTRGLDLPDLTHVFILGIPNGPKVNGRTVDAYVHLAGRVGRFGRGGKVVTVIEDGATETVSEESKILRILDTIKEIPIRFEHFD